MPAKAGLLLASRRPAYAEYKEYTREWCVPTRTIAQVTRYTVVLLGGFIAGGRMVSAIHAWREWHTWEDVDPSGADAYRTFFLMDLSVLALSVVIAGLVWWLLRPPPPRDQP